MVVRILMSLLSVAATLLVAGYLGDQWRHTSKWLNVGRVGLCAYLLYTAIGHIKALKLYFPVDWVTFVGLIAIVVTVMGFGMEFIRRTLLPKIVRYLSRQEE